MNELTQHTGQGEIILYQPDETVRLEVRLEDDTVWLNRQQLAELFGRDVKTIGKHINNALKEELRKVPTVAKFAIVQKEGNRIVSRTIIYTEHVGQSLQHLQQLNQQQYGRRIEVKEYNNRFHDRFLILDDALYHFGASFKDLGKRLFAFELMGIDKNIILNQL